MKIQRRLIILFGISIMLIFLLNLPTLAKPSQKTTEDKITNTEELTIEQLIENKNYDKAFQKCKQLILNKNNDKESFKKAYENFSQLLGKENINSDEIVEFYLNIPNEEISYNIQPLFLVVSHLSSKQKYDKAAKILDKINEIFPNNQFYINTAPVIYSKIKRTEEAYKIINTELSKKPDPITEKNLKTILIDVYINDNKIDDAIKLVDELMNKYPDDQTYKDFLSYIALKTKSYDKTIKVSKKYLEKYSTDEVGLKNLFFQAYKSGNFDEALNHFENLANKNPDDISLQVLLANVNIITKNYETASVLIEKLLKTYPKISIIHLLKGRLLFDTQKYEDAYNYLKNYVNEFKDEIEDKTYYYLALSCIKTKRIIEAIENTEKEIKHNPSNSRLLIREIEEMFYNEKMFHTAINFFSALKQKFENDHELLAKIALFNYYAGNTQIAIQLGEQVLSLLPDSIPTKYILGLAYEKTGNIKRAIELFKQCCENMPKVEDDVEEIMKSGAGIIWPFGHGHLCYIHAALRCGEIKKVSEGLNSLLTMIFKKVPPKFIVKDIQKANPFLTREEYSFEKSFNFFAKHILTEQHIKNYESKGEIGEIVNYYIKNNKIRELYNQSLKAQMSGKYDEVLNLTLKALEIDPNNLFLILRAASAGIISNSHLMIPITMKILTYQLPENASDEEKALKCCVSAFKIGAKNSLNQGISMLKAFSNEQIFNESKAYVDEKELLEFETEINNLKNTKFKNISLLMQATLNYFKGNLGENKNIILTYLNSEPELSTFMWFITSFGSFFTK